MQSMTTRSAGRGYLTSWNPRQAAAYFAQHGHLLSQLVRRDVQARYRGSWLGPLWSLLTPLMMLAVYTFVFSVVFQARWGGQQASRLDFALSAFGSIMLFNLFAEVVNSAGTLIVGNPNYVKRVVFPLELLPLAKFLSCAVQSAVGLGVFFVAILVLKQSCAWTWLLAPLMLIPLALLCLGLSYLLSAVGVFVRDINHLVGLLTTMLLFLSPVFYPLSQLPEHWQQLLSINPLAPILENFRLVTLGGQWPNWSTWASGTAITALMAVLAYSAFKRSQHAFADVV